MTSPNETTKRLDIKQSPPNLPSTSIHIQLIIVISQTNNNSPEAEIINNACRNLQERNEEF